MSEPIYLVKGYGVKLEVFEDKVIIKRQGIGSLFIHGLKGDKTFFFKNITAMQLKKAGLTSGYLQFSIPGGNESRGALFSAVRDENTFIFQNKKYNELIEEVKNYIEQKLVEINNKSFSQISIADEILKFKKLLDDEIITQEEFSRKKQELLIAGPPSSPPPPSRPPKKP